MRLKVKWAFVLALAVWLRLGGPAVLAAPDPGDYCGNGTCDTGSCSIDQSPGDGCHENWHNCPEDCWDKCGDGICQVRIEADCNNLDLWCEDDCGSDSVCPGNGECDSSDDCDSGETCTPWHECVAVSPAEPEPPDPSECGGECTSSDDCCGSDVCYGDDGTQQSGYCGPPEQDWCPDSPECSSTSQCETIYFGLGVEVYCDPGLGRCQFIDSAACPVAPSR